MIDIIVLLSIVSMRNKVYEKNAVADNYWYLLAVQT